MLHEAIRVAMLDPDHGLSSSTFCTTAASQELLGAYKKGMKGMVFP